MPKIAALGGLSSRGFGEFNQQATGKYIEDYFSTYLYTGNGSTQTINNGMGLAATGAWGTYKIQQSTSQVRGVYVDSSANLYATGTATDSGAYIFVTKFNSSGTLQWQRRIAEQGCTSGAISVDASGNIYITGGTYDGTYYYILIAKYNSSGVLQWQRKLQQNSSGGRGISVDSSGNIYVCGYANDGATNYIITAKYNSSGSLQWQRKLKQNSAANEYGNAIFVSSANEVYITGYLNDGTFPYLILAKYDSSGVIQWKRKLQDSSGSGSYGYGVSGDSIGNVYITGLGSDGTNNYCLLAQYNSSGTIQWQRKIYQNATAGLGVSCDSANNCYVCGYANDGVTNYMFLAKYNSSGAIQWQRKLQQNLTYGYASATDNSGGVYAAGSPTGSDGFLYASISKIASDGSSTSGTAFLSLSVSSMTEAVGTATDSNASGASESAAGASDSAGGATDSAGTASISIAGQPAITGGGGLVWAKCRTTTYSNQLYDTSRGATNALFSNLTDAQLNIPTGLTSFSASGFSLGSNVAINASGQTYASWTFTETPKFFDVVTYTGNLTARNISHNLGSVPGMIIIKCVSDPGYNWIVYHRSLDVSGFGSKTSYIYLNTTGAAGASSAFWNDTDPTDTVFTVGATAAVNQTGYTYVAYLFAHNAGGFGADGSQNVISCGTFTTNASALASVTLGYEPQYIICKKSNGISNWFIFDTMRGMAQSGNQALYAETSGAEVNYGTDGIIPTATGFNCSGIASNSDFIYMAIRRGPMRTPTSGTSVFNPQIYTGDYNTTTPITGMNPATDMWWNANRASSSYYSMDRLRGWNYIYTASTSAENTSVTWTTQTQTSMLPSSSWWGSSANQINYFLNRAPGFFDVVCYTGTGSAQSISHNLGAIPEMMIVKSRNTGSTSWMVYNKNVNGGVTPEQYYLLLQSDQAPVALSAVWNDTAPTSSVFTVGSQGSSGASGRTYVAYLFASCPGVSKVGSYTGTGGTQTISCGFTGGARFVLIKRTDTTGSWYVWDTARGMVAGTDPYLLTNVGAAEVNTNSVYTTTGGFQIVSTAADINASGGSYIYLAIA